MISRRLAPLLLGAALAAPSALSGCTRLFDTASLEPLGSALGFCQARYDAEYQWDVRCSGWDPTHAVQRPEYWYRARCEPLAKSVDAGRMTYDRASAEDCLAAYDASDCRLNPKNEVDACVYAIAPAVAEGGECVTSYDCLAPGWCASPDRTCPGHCVGLGPLDAGCDDDHPCGPGGWCDAGTCAPRKRSGEACAGNCLENLSCNAGWCSYVSGPNEPCATQADCDPFQPLYCRDGDFTCQPLPALGEPCTSADACAAGYFCETTNHKCYTVPTAPQPDDESCSPPFFCAGSSWCDPSSGTPTCKPRVALGKTCADPNACLQPGWCDQSGAPATWSCKPPRIAGQPCNTTGAGCNVGAWCRATSGPEGICESERDIGESCGWLDGLLVGDYAGCSWGYCDGDPVGVCRPEGRAGARCADSGQCISRDCDPDTGTCRETCPINR